MEFPSSGSRDDSRFKHSSLIPILRNDSGQSSSQTSQQSSGHVEPTQLIGPSKLRQKELKNNEVSTSRFVDSTRRRTRSDVYQSNFRSRILPESDNSTAFDTHDDKLLDDVNRALRLRALRQPSRSENRSPENDSSLLLNSSPSNTGHATTRHTATSGHDRSSVLHHTDVITGDRPPSPSNARVRTRSLLSRFRTSSSFMNAKSHSPNRPNQVREPQITVSQESINRARAVKKELSRRYTAIYTSLEPHSKPLNPLAVIRYLAEFHPGTFTDDVMTLEDQIVSRVRLRPYYLNASAIESFEQWAANSLAPNPRPTFSPSRASTPSSFSSMGRWSGTIAVSIAGEPHSSTGVVSQMSNPSLGATAPFGNAYNSPQDDEKIRRILPHSSRKSRYPQLSPPPRHVPRRATPLRTSRISSRDPTSPLGSRFINSQSSEDVGGQPRWNVHYSPQGANRGHRWIRESPRPSMDQLSSPMRFVTHESKTNYTNRAILLQRFIDRNLAVERMLHSFYRRLDSYNQLHQLLSLHCGVQIVGVDDVLHDPVARLSMQEESGRVDMEKSWSANTVQHNRIQEYLRRQLDLEVSAPLDDSRESIRASGGLSQLKDVLTRMRGEAENANQSLHQVEALQTEVMLKFHSVYGLTSEDYPEMQTISWMAEQYVPLRIKLSHILWQWGGPMLDFIGTNIAAPVVKSYGKRYLWPDIRDFVIIPYFKTDYDGGDPNEFQLRFPRRSVAHWLSAVTFDLCCFGLSKLLWDFATILAPLAQTLGREIQHGYIARLAWVVIWAMSLVMGISSACFGFVAFSIISAVLWWLVWYLTPRDGTDSRSVIGWSAAASSLAVSLVAYVWWMLHSDPIWRRFEYLALLQKA